jgi:hypothetical protein
VKVIEFARNLVSLFDKKDETVLSLLHEPFTPPLLLTNTASEADEQNPPLQIT